jgi:hypothetical protein
LHAGYDLVKLIVAGVIDACLLADPVKGLIIVRNVEAGIFDQGFKGKAVVVDFHY